MIRSSEKLFITVVEKREIRRKDLAKQRGKLSTFWIRNGTERKRRLGCREWEDERGSWNMMIRDTGRMEDVHEAHFYHEDPLPTLITSPLNYEKDNLHLNLQPDLHHSNPRLEQLRRNNIPAEISSPDFGFLKLASPDLEKMLLAFQAGGNDSPTGTAHATVDALATSVSGEHRNHSKGFAETLQDLHDHQDIRNAPNIISQLTQGTYVEESATTTDQLYLTTDSSGSITVASMRDKYQSTPLTNAFGAVTTVLGNEKQLNASHVLQQFHANTFLPNSVVPAHQLFTTPPLRQHTTDDNVTAAQLRALAAYNNVLAPNVGFPSQVFKLDAASMFADNSGLQPIDLEVQETVKRERKKQRNRVASSKCRKRKLEKEAVLETTVKDLKTKNVELSTLANALKQQICDLKQKVMDHVTEGCPITSQHVEDPNELLYNEQDWEPLSERT